MSADDSMKNRCCRFAYVAGLLDGEGCLSIQVDKGRRSYAPIVSMGLTKGREILEGIRQQWGGAVNLLVSRSERWSDQSRLSLSGKNAIKLLHDVAPYLILKRQQADILFRLWELIESLLVFGRSSKWTVDASAQALELKRRVMTLNCKGPASASLIGTGGV